MRCRLILAFALLAGPSGLAEAQQFDGSYYCVTEFSGGIAYDEKLQKLDAARFRPTGKFVLRLKHIGPTSCFEKVCYSDEYFVWVTPSGSDKVEQCLTYYPQRSERITFTRDAGRGDCEAGSKRYTFGMKLKRFQSTFEFGGYAIGMDKDSDTPSMSGGTCTKIQ